MAKWKIYYSDGSTISSNDATPWSIDRRGDVQVIIQQNEEHNWVTTTGYDYYVWDVRGDTAKWWRADIFGLYHYLLQPGHKCVLFGTKIDKITYREIFDRARSEFGEKTGFDKDEVKP